MHRSLHSLSRRFDALNTWVGHAVSWLSLAIVVLMFANVAIRYLFGGGAPWQMELVQAMHAAAFLAAMGYTLLAGGQVRVDVFYSRFSPRTKAWVELIGAGVLLAPLCVVLMWYAWPYVRASWALREASSEYNGLQGVFLLKSFLLIGPALLLLQGISGAIRAGAVLTACGTQEKPHG